MLFCGTEKKRWRWKRKESEQEHLPPPLFSTAFQPQKIKEGENRMITRFDPFQEVLGLRDAMNQLFEESFVRPTWRRPTSTVLSFPIDVLETENGYQVHALLPGLSPENVEVSVLENTLTIKGHLEAWVQPGLQGSWLAREIGTGTFERSISFPKAIDVDKIETSYQNGVLHMDVPFSEGSRPRKISITSGQTNQITVEAGKH